MRGKLTYAGTFKVNIFPARAFSKQKFNLFKFYDI